MRPGLTSLSSSLTTVPKQNEVEGDASKVSATPECLSTVDVDCSSDESDNEAPRCLRPSRAAQAGGAGGAPAPEAPVMRVRASRPSVDQQVDNILKSFQDNPRLVRASGSNDLSAAETQKSVAAAKAILKSSQDAKSGLYVLDPELLKGLATRSGGLLTVYLVSAALVGASLNPAPILMLIGFQLQSEVMPAAVAEFRAFIQAKCKVPLPQ